MEASEDSSTLSSLVHNIAMQPSAPSTLILTTGVAILLGVAITFASCWGGEWRLIKHFTFSQLKLFLYVRCGRARNLLCSPLDRLRQRYPIAYTCQIPAQQSLSDIYKHVFGYKTRGTFVEVGAYDGETFSNTSALADLGWTGFYIEPIPEYAKACKRRHSANPRVSVHNICISDLDGDLVELSSEAGGEVGSTPQGGQPNSPAQSASGSNNSNNNNSNNATNTIDPSVSSSSATSEDTPTQISSNVESNPLSPATGKLTCSTVTLNTYFMRYNLTPGQVDVLVVDEEGLEWQILKGFDAKAWRPKLVILEMRDRLAQNFDNEQIQTDAIHIERYFAQAGYRILYRDIYNTIFMHKDVACVGC